MQNVAAVCPEWTQWITDISTWEAEDYYNHTFTKRNLLFPNTSNLGRVFELVRHYKYVFAHIINMPYCSHDRDQVFSGTNIAFEFIRCTLPQASTFTILQTKQSDLVLLESTSGDNCISRLWSKYLLSSTSFVTAFIPLPLVPGEQVKPGIKCTRLEQESNRPPLAPYQDTPKAKPP